jgi:surface carbohydrate biosynthesis protein
MNLNRAKEIIIKIKYLIILSLRAKKIFSKPPQKKIIVFDCESPKQLHELFSTDNTYLLTTRVQKITKLFLSLSLFQFIIKNFFKRSLRVNYLIFLILRINPKVVITMIDNSKDFYTISKLLDRKIKFIAIQQASREVQWLPLKWTKKIYLPEYYCYGDFDKKIYLKKTKVIDIEPKGSFKAACALTYIKKNNIKIKKEFDICLISEINLGERKYISKKKNFWKRDERDVKDLDHIPTYNSATSKLARYTYRFAEKYNLNIVIAGKGEKNTKYREEELSWYRNVLNKKKIDLRARNEKNFSNYQLLLKSEVVIAMRASLTREAIGYNKKAFWCNFANHSDAGFPFFKKIKKFVIDKDSYEIFEKKLKFILKTKNKSYFNYIKKVKREISANHKGYDEFILKRVNKIIND